MSAWWAGGQKTKSNHLELEVQVVAIHHAGTGNGTRVLNKNSSALNCWTISLVSTYRYLSSSA